MDAVADELGKERVGGEQHADDAGLAMIERTHGVEGVRGARRSGGQAGAGFSHGRVRVADGDAYSAGDGVFCELKRAGKFGRESHQAHVAFGGFKHAIEEGDVGLEDVLGRMHAAAQMRNERAFEMNAGDAGAAVLGRGGDEFCEAFERAQRGVNARGDGGGEKVGRAVRGEECGDGVEGFGSRFHHVAAGRAVNVHVEVGGSERGSGIMERLRAGRQSGLAARCDRDDAAVFDGDDWMLKNGASAHKAVGGDDGWHKE